MTKHLRFLFVMLLAMIWSAGWAAETKTVVCTLAQKSNACTADVNGVVSWSYAAAKSTDSSNRGIQWYTPKNVILTANFTSVVKITEVVVNANSNTTGSTIALNVGKTSYGKKNIAKGTVSPEDNGNANYSYIGTESSNVMTLKLNSSKSLYINTVTITYEVGDSKTDTKVSFGENSGKKFTFSKGVYTKGEFTTPIAKEKDNIAGTVVYSSNNEAAISVDASTGKLTFNDFGEATITATFTPNNTEIYKSSNDSYEVVNDNPDVRKVTFIDTVDKGENRTTGKSETITKDGVTIYASNAAFGYDTKYRFYKDGTINISATTGTITRIDFAGGEDLTNLKGDGFTATATDATWTGNARSVVLTNDIGSAKARTITVFVDLSSEITLNENSESNTIEAKTGVNVTLKRTMVKGEWNTICLPFGLTSEQITTVFGVGVKVAQLDDTNSTGATLKFVDMTDTGMEASVPYLIKPIIAAPADGYKFEGVEIKVAAVTPTKVKTNGNLYFNGIYNMVDITKDVDNVGASYYAAFLGADNKIYKAKANGNKTKGFRAYFAIPKSASASALRVVIDGTATSIKNIGSEVVESNAPVYNLQGQRVDGNNLTPGIYVKAGKKFVVK